MANKLPTPDYLRSVFVYSNGMLFWRPRPLDHFRSLRACFYVERQLRRKEGGPANADMRNTSGWASKPVRVGVHRKANGRWTAGIRCDGKQRHLGTFATEEEANAVRAAAEAEIYGKYARKAA